MLVAATALTFVCLLFIAINIGCLNAVRWSAFFALIVPTWTGMGVGAATIDIRLACFLFACLFYAISTSPKRGWSLCFLDLCVIGILLSFSFSLVSANLLGATGILSIVLIWCTPYAFGRLLGSLPEPGSKLAPVLFLTAGVYAVVVAIESITHVNPINLIVGKSGSYAAEEGQRWGLRRADGIATHPIFMGMLLVSLHPWVLASVRHFRHTGMFGISGSLLTHVAFPALLVSTIFPMSRGPLLIMLGTVACVVFLREKSLRVPLAVCCLVILCFAVVRSNDVLNGLKSAAQDTGEASITIRGETYEYTGTNHRYLQLVVFKDALADAGFFGFGTSFFDGVSLASYVEPHLQQLFQSVDNHYVLTVLCYGYSGLCFSVLIMATGVVYAIGLWRLHRDTFSAAILGCSLMSMLMLATVWLDPDFAFMMQFNFGFIATAWTRRNAIDSQSSFCSSTGAQIPLDGVFPRCGFAFSGLESEIPSTHFIGRTTAMAEQSRGGLLDASMSGSKHSPRMSAASRIAPLPLESAKINHLWRWLPVAILAGAIAIPSAWYFAPYFESKLWVHTMRLAFRNGYLQINAYRAPELSEILPVVASAGSISQAVNGVADEAAVQKKLLVRSTPGTQYIDLTLRWEDREQGERLLNQIAENAVQKSVDLRSDRLEVARLNIDSELKEAEVIIAGLEAQLSDLHTTYKTTGVAEDLRAVTQEIRALEVQLLGSLAERKGIESRLIHRQGQTARKLASGASEDALIASINRRRELQLLIAKQAFDTGAAKAKIQFESQKADVDRKRSLNQRRLLSDAELQRAEAQLELYRIEWERPGGAGRLEEELVRLEKDLEVADLSDKDNFFQLVAEDIENRETIVSLEDRLANNRHQENILREALPKETRLRSVISDAQSRLHQLRHVSQTMTSFERSTIHQLVVDKTVALDIPPIVSDKNKIMAGLFVGLFGLVGFPFVLFDSLKLKRQQKLSEFTNIGLGQLTNSDHKLHYLEQQDNPASLVAPPADVRRMIHQLITVMPTHDYVLLFASLQKEPPSMALMFDVARCFARRSRNVLLLVVEPSILDVETGEPKPRLRETAYARQLPDHFEIQYVDGVSEAVAGLEQFRREYDLVIVAAGFDASDSRDLDLLSFYSDGVVVSDIGTGKNLKRRVDIIRQLNDCQGNILGLMN